MKSPWNYPWAVVREIYAKLRREMENLERLAKARRK